MGATDGDFGLSIYNSLGRESLLLAKRIQDIDIQIKDQNNNFIDFNFINWNITLVLNIHRQVGEGGNRADGIILFDKLQKITKANDILDMSKKERDAELLKIKQDTDKEIMRIDKISENDLMLENLK